MVAHVLCSLCDSIQNQSQKRRCKQQNCLARILWWWNAEIIRNDTLDFFLLLNSWIKCSIFLSHYWNIFYTVIFFKFKWYENLLDIFYTLDKMIVNRSWNSNTNSLMYTKQIALWFYYLISQLSIIKTTMTSDLWKTTRAWLAMIFHCNWWSFTMRWKE